MKEEIFERHDKEWLAFHEKREKARSQLAKDERLVQKSFGIGQILPDEWQEKIDRDKEAWQEEWAMDGRRATEIRERQEQERKPRAFNTEPYSEEEMDALYENSKQSEKPLEGKRNKPTPIDLLQYPERSSSWEAIYAEVNAISDAYNENKEEIPRATQQRMKKRIAAFRQKWQGIEPKMPLEEWKTLDENDHQNQFESFRALTKSHNIIEAHYGHPDKVPKASDEFMAQEIQEYYQEIDAYQNRNAIKQQLETIRNRPRQPKPRLG